MFTVYISYEGETKKIKADNNALLWKLLRDNRIYIPAFCGGHGKCGKCLVKIDEGFIGNFSAGETILACKARITDNCSITVLANEKDFAITDTFSGAEIAENKISNNLAIAVDIGTTTIVVCAIDMETGKTVGVSTTINKQREFGTDVISRIEKCAEYLDEMTASVRNDILQCIETILFERNILPKKINKVAIVGNSTMIALLLNEDCTSMGIAPFIMPEKVKKGVTLSFSELFSSVILKCDVVTLPCISAYIGADALAAALFIGLQNKNGYNLIADVGTNGELLLSVAGKNEVLCASTAAGPALEGGNISCGMGGAAGAVCSVIYKDKTFIYKTIGNKPPLGICGSGAIDLTAALLENDLIDGTGLLDDDYFDNGISICENVLFMQADIRQMQLAKSAIRAGIDCLLKDAEIGYDSVQSVFLAGGFSNNAKIDNLVKIGLLPKELLSKTILVGNAALGGAVKWLFNETVRSEAKEIIRNAKELELGSNPYFSERFVDNMMFDI